MTCALRLFDSYPGPLLSQGGVAYVVGSTFYLSKSIARGNSADDLADFLMFSGHTDVSVVDCEIDQDADSVDGGQIITAESGCAAGSYGNCTSLGDSIYSCKFDVCSLCPTGTFVARTGSLDIFDCEDCAEGYFNNETGSTSCLLCPAGSYVTDSAEDTDGFGVESRGTHCVSCPSGRISSNIGSSSCDACEAGTTSTANGTECESCLEGTYASFTASPECSECAPGYFQASSGSLSCVSCTAPATSYKGASNCTVSFGLCSISFPDCFSDII